MKKVDTVRISVIDARREMLSVRASVRRR